MTAAPHHDVAIVGTGFSGLCMAIQLARSKQRSFVLLERAGGVGGTWRDNHYPGCACDVPSHLYSFSFAPNPTWSRMFAPQAEILAYLESQVARHDLGPHLRLDTEVTEAAWDDRANLWRISTSRGALTARHLVLGVGALSRPSIPAIPGADSFTGRAFHSAQWDHGFDPTGRDVAVIGTGASAIQFVPRLAARVRRLDLYQRTPPWVLPKPDRAVTAAERRLFAAAPLTQRLYRSYIYWRMEARGLGFTVDPRIMQLAAVIGRRHIARGIADPALRARVTPDYTPGCKRILMADDYYPALARSTTEVISDRIEAITPRGVVAAGRERPVSAIIYGTGFKVSELLTPMRVLGRDGRELNSEWRTRIDAYLGITVAGYPNLFLLMGPNTGLGHNSMVFMIESQVNWVLGCMRALAARGGRTVEVRPEAQHAFNRALEPRLQKAVWAAGCQSWYLDENGHNSSLWPGFTFEYWLRTRRPRLADLRLQAA